MSAFLLQADKAMVLANKHFHSRVVAALLLFDSGRRDAMAKKAHKAAQGDDLIVDAPTLARVCCLHVRTILKLAEQGIVVRVARGRYAQWASIGNLIEHYREQAAGHIGRDESALTANSRIPNDASMTFASLEWKGAYLFARGRGRLGGDRAGHAAAFYVPSSAR